MKRKQWASLVLAAAMAVSVIASPLSALAAVRPQPLKEPAAAGLDDGLVLYSSFDDETAADLSGSGNNGTLVGDLKFAEGVRGKALLIEGQNVAASDDRQGDRYVDYGKNIQFGTEDFSISLWYKVTGESSNSALISNKNYKSGSNTGFAVGRFGNGINLNTAANNTRGELTAYVSDEEPGKEEDPAFTALRENYRDYLLGGDGTGLDMTNAGVKAYVENLNKTANGYYEDLIKSDVAGRTDLFADLELCPEADYIGKFSQDPYYTYTSNLGTTARRLRDIAFAWATEGCDLYHNDEVLAELISALDHFTDNYCTGKYSGKSGGNWYQWVITVPDALMSTCIVLYDELSASQLQHYVDVCKWYVPDCMVQGPHSNDPKMTGGNLLLKANSTLQTAILDQNTDMLANVKEGVKTVLVYNDASQFYTKDADGFYKDGSYIQHQALAYIGGYGSDLYKNLGVFLLVLNDSDWEIAYEDGREQVAYDTVFNGIEPFMYGRAHDGYGVQP